MAFAASTQLASLSECGADPAPLRDGGAQDWGWLAPAHAIGVGLAVPGVVGKLLRDALIGGPALPVRRWLT